MDGFLYLSDDLCSNEFWYACVFGVGRLPRVMLN